MMINSIEVSKQKLCMAMSATKLQQESKRSSRSACAKGSSKHWYLSSLPQQKTSRNCVKTWKRLLCRQCLLGVAEEEQSYQGVFARGG